MAVISFKCPNCDGELIFDPAEQKYKCEYCNSLFTQTELDAIQEGMGNQQQERIMQEETGGNARADEENEAVVYCCPSCGAEVVTEETTAATFCYYCHNPIVLGRRLEGKYLPDKIIPFYVSKEAAVKGFLDFVGKKKFIPKAFFNKRQIESMTGVYFPYWLYDVKLDGRMQGEAKRIRVYRSKDTEYTETKIYRVEREGEICLQNLSERALSKANNMKLAEGIMPYEFDHTAKFHMGYLSGFFAERRDIERAAIQGKMQGAMRQSAEKLLRETVSGYDTVNINNAGFVPKKESWSYVLLPAWTITYKGKNGKIYYYSMNGQTGKICGELPLSYGKVLAVSAIVAGIVLLAGLIGGYFI